MEKCLVALLDDTEVKISVSKTDKGQHVLDKVCQHLNIIEKDYFGLKFQDSACRDLWIHPDKLIRKQLLEA